DRRRVVPQARGRGLRHLLQRTLVRGRGGGHDARKVPREGSGRNRTSTTATNGNEFLLGGSRRGSVLTAEGSPGTGMPKGGFHMRKAIFAVRGLWRRKRKHFRHGQRNRRWTVDDRQGFDLQRDPLQLGFRWRDSHLQ